MLCCFIQEVAYYFILDRIFCSFLHETQRGFHSKANFESVSHMGIKSLNLQFSVTKMSHSFPDHLKLTLQDKLKESIFR